MKLSISIILFFNAFTTKIYCQSVDLLCEGCEGLIVDTDIGGDDAMAISMLLNAEAKGYSWGKIISFTTVTGNTGATNATRNVKALLKLFKRNEIPVYRGMEDGLSVHTPPSGWFGFDGLGDFLPPIPSSPTLPTNLNPGLYLASMVHRYPGKISILALGPLTNLAMALHFNSEFFNEVRSIVILGGNYKGGGNTSPGIEANMFSDPDGANFFFSKIPTSAANKIILVPVETVYDYATYPVNYRLNVLGRYNNTVMKFLNKAESLTFSKNGDVWPCYDPTAASVLLDRSIVTKIVLGKVEVVTQGPRGAMFASFDGPSFNVNIITQISRNGLKKLLESYLS